MPQKNLENIIGFCTKTRLFKSATVKAILSKFLSHVETIKPRRVKKRSFSAFRRNAKLLISEFGAIWGDLGRPP
jgi:hypothetical protein